jgi:hypothetical protein
MQPLASCLVAQIVKLLNRQDGCTVAHDSPIDACLIKILGVAIFILFFWWRRLIHSKGARTSAERLFTLAAQRMRSPKKTRDALPPTAEGTTATQQLPSCCQGRSQRERQPRPPLLSHQRGV